MSGVWKLTHQSSLLLDVKSDNRQEEEILLRLNEDGIIPLMDMKLALNFRVKIFTWHWAEARWVLGISWQQALFGTQETQRCWPIKGSRHFTSRGVEYQSKRLSIYGGQSWAKWMKAMLMPTKKKTIMLKLMSIYQLPKAIFPLESSRILESIKLSLMIQCLKSSIGSFSASHKYWGTWMQGSRARGKTKARGKIPQERFLRSTILLDSYSPSCPPRLCRKGQALWLKQGSS